MIFERARLDDMEALVELRLAYLTEDFGALDPAVSISIAEALPGYFREHLNRDMFCYVAREAGRVVACAFLLIVRKPPSPAFISGVTGSVMNVYTRPECRRRGVARRVMQTLMDDANDMGVCALNLRATDAGYPVYKSVGFVDDVNKYHPMKWKP